jgi:hypothetical protein
MAASAARLGAVSSRLEAGGGRADETAGASPRQRKVSRTRMIVWRCNRPDLEYQKY